MIFCVTCQHHYHLACLDPPLTKMPKLSGGDFQCSDCACASESEHEDAAVKKENSPVGSVNNYRSAMIKLCRRRMQTCPWPSAESRESGPLQ